MAHTCPECGRLCYCGGDIDDIDMGENSNCTCPCWQEEYDDDDDIYNDDDDEIWDSPSLPTPPAQTYNDKKEMV
jgi:hypothetical protein